MSTHPHRLRSLALVNIAVLFFGLAVVLGKLSTLPAPLIVLRCTVLPDVR